MVYVKKIRSWHGECREKSAIFYIASWHLSEPGTLGFTRIHQELAEKKPFFGFNVLAAGRRGVDVCQRGARK
jgi:hypothetical protein